jgi:hypothetical protein
VVLGDREGLAQDADGLLAAATVEEIDRAADQGAGERRPRLGELERRQRVFEQRPALIEVACEHEHATQLGERLSAENRIDARVVDRAKRLEQLSGLVEPARGHQHD